MCVAGSGRLVSALWSGVGSWLGVVRENCVLVVSVPHWGDVREVECGDTNISLATPTPLYSNICRDSSWLWFSPGPALSWLAFIHLSSEDNPEDVPAAGLRLADLSSQAGGLTEVELGVEER